MKKISISTGTGDINWSKVFSALDKINYTGVYNLEISPLHFGKDFALEEIAFAVKALKQLLKNQESQNA